MKFLILAFLLLISLQLVYTTPEADEDKVDESLVANIPGDWYSGYLKAGQGDKYSLHYWFFTMEKDNGFDDPDTTTPLLLWLNNGPGCSSMYEATHGNGPFVFNKKNTNLVFQENTHTWVNQANVLYIDGPGVGFSSRHPEDEYDDEMVELFQQALYKFFQRFPEFDKRNLYIGGTGYAGIYVPKLAASIWESNDVASASQKISIKGVIVGNGATTLEQINSRDEDYPHAQIEFLRAYGIINSQLYYEFSEKCGWDRTQDIFNSQECKDTIFKIKVQLVGLNFKSVDDPCFYSEQAGGFDQCRDDSKAIQWFNNIDTKNALHVDNTTDWTPCNYNQKYKKSYGSLIDYGTLVMAGLKIWVYSGDMDAEIPHQSTVSWIKELRERYGLSDIVPYQTWFYQDKLLASQAQSQREQQGGSYWRMDGLTYIRFKGCGQNVAGDNALAAEEMFKNYINGKEMETDFLYWQKTQPQQ